MRFLKYSTMFILCLTHAISQDGMRRYSLDDCLNSNFDIKVKHATLPFGLLPMSVNVKKESCVIDFELVRYFIWKDKWQIDVCRDPIHLKKGRSLDEVLKKSMNCNFQAKNNVFCQELESISAIIEDNLLVYAKGEKENLDTDHGKSYCSFELIKQYLDRNKIYSRYDDEESGRKQKMREELFNKPVPKTKETPEIKPEMKPEIKPKMGNKKEKTSEEIIKEAQNPEIKIEAPKMNEIDIPTEKIEI